LQGAKAFAALSPRRFRGAFAVLNALGQRPKRKDLCFRQGLVSIRTICEDARELRHFSQPATIFISLGLDAQLHRTFLNVTQTDA
jgi:hypothetical protein